MLLRVLRRRTSAALPADEFINVELRQRGVVDLSISCYEITPSEVVRTVAEHTSSFLDGPKTFATIDLGAGVLPNTVATDGQTLFRHANAAHREAIFSNETNLQRHIDSTLKVGATGSVEKITLAGYICECQRKEDPEWSRVLEMPERKKWKRLIESYSKAQAERPSN